MAQHRLRSVSLVPLVPVVALLLSFVLSVGTVAAANPTVTTNPALVPFSEAPGLPGATQLTFTANGTSGLVACGQDNGVLPTFRLGPVDPATPLVVNFPFIQAGVYTFWLSADPTCAVGSKFAAGGTPVQATATRLGPDGLAGQDDVQVRFNGPNFSSTNGLKSGFSFDLALLGLLPPGVPPAIQPFPIPGVRVCMMSGDGAQVTVKMQVGQDARPQGLGAAAVTTTVTPFAGQNGCFAIPWMVNGAYVASIARSGATSSFGFCAGFNTPSNPPTAAGIGKCAQVAFFPDPANPQPTGTTINGSIVTGADNHAVQVCASAFSPGPTNGGPAVQRLANQVNAYNGSGAVNLTPLTIPTTFPAKTVLKLTTYDITGPGLGGAGGAQFTCPTATAIQSGTTITAISVPDVPGATIIDTKNYFIA